MQENITQKVMRVVETFRQKRSEDLHWQTSSEEKIKVHETISKAAYIYEKIRNAIDYQEEHLIRKNAIRRMLRRRITLKERGLNVAEPLILELIRARYLPNNFIPESRIIGVKEKIDKCVNLIDFINAHQPMDRRNKLMKWVLSIAACEIEEYLVPLVREDAMVECMYKIVRPDIDLVRGIADERDKNIQVYLAIHRALIKSDADILRFHLFNFYVPKWNEATPELIQKVAVNINKIEDKIEKQIHHKLSDSIYIYLKKFSPLFVILQDVVSENLERAEEVLSDPDKLETEIRKACQKRYYQASVKLSRGVVRSIIYIFFTKSILAFFLELPYERVFLHHIKWIPLGVNIVFHPILMAVIATSIRVPAERNTQRIIQGIKEIVYDLPEREILKKKKQITKRSTFSKILFTFIYTLTFLITFGLIIWGLRTLEFSIVSGFLFLFFLSIISFFGLRLRYGATELVVIGKRENILTLVVDFFTLPIVRVGHWIASKTSQVNIFLFILDFIIEAPFKVVTETIEDWVSFQKEKKEEIY